MIQKKTLPYKVPSVMLTYPYNAFYFGILEANKFYRSSIENILINDFTELYYYKSDRKSEINFTKSGTFEQNRFKSHKLPKTKNIIQTIKEYLNNDYYAIVMFNQKYISDSRVHCSWDYYHDWLIFGYDDKNSVFMCSGYIGENQNGGILNTIELPYLEIEKALLNVSKKYTMFKSKYFQNHFIKINKSWIEHEPNNIEIRQKLNNVLCKKIIIKDFQVHFHVGINAIRKIQKEFKKIYFYKKYNEKIYLQNIRILYEYRKNILICLKRIDSNERFVDTYQKLIDETYKCLLLALKFNITNNEKLIERICNILFSIEHEEEKLLKTINLKLYTIG